jgi:hypothetical protein
MIGRVKTGATGVDRETPRADFNGFESCPVDVGGDGSVAGVGIDVVEVPGADEPRDSSASSSAMARPESTNKNTNETDSTASERATIRMTASMFATANLPQARPGECRKT